MLKALLGITAAIGLGYLLYSQQEAMNRSAVLGLLEDVPFRAHGYAIQDGKDGRRHFVEYRRNSNRTSLRVTVRQYPSHRTMLDHLIIDRGALAGNLTATPSGYPVAGEFAGHDREYGQTVFLALSRYSLTVSTSYRAEGLGLERTHFNESTASDTRLVEGSARALMGGLIGRECGPSYHVVFNGQLLRASRGLNGNPCWCLRDWCLAVGAPLRIDHETGLAQFVLNSKTTVVPLAAQTVTRSGHSVPLLETTFSRHHEWFVDAAFLQNA